jgi:hypothetical protein
MKLKPILLTLSLTALFTNAALAATITFVPPNDTTGSVYSTNDNDGYEDSRGLVFRSTTAQIIDSIGIYLDVTNTLLNWVIYQTTGITGDVATGQVELDSGSLLANTTGLEWIDISIAPLALAANSTYHIAFSHTAAANQNFYYNNSNTTWTQGAFTLLDGTGAGDTGNSVVAAIRLNAEADPGTGVPEPATVWLTAGALTIALGTRRRFVRY